MFLAHVLSQLAILGATSIVLGDGGVIVPFADADDLLTMVAPYRRFRLRACECYVDVVDDSGQLFGRAITIWRADDRRAFEQDDVQILASR
jgi:hypothetical protein